MRARRTAHLTGTDAVFHEVFARLGQLRAERDSLDPVEFCRKFWSVLRSIYVVDAADAHRIDWGRCELPNERAFMKYWNEVVSPSLESLRLSPERLAEARRVEQAGHRRGFSPGEDQRVDSSEVLGHADVHTLDTERVEHFTMLAERPLQREDAGECSTHRNLPRRCVAGSRRVGRVLSSPRWARPGVGESFACSSRPLQHRQIGIGVLQGRETSYACRAAASPAMARARPRPSQAMWGQDVGWQAGDAPSHGNICETAASGG
jgi:hypothetical protein